MQNSTMTPGIDRAQLVHEVAEEENVSAALVDACLEALIEMGEMPLGNGLTLVGSSEVVGVEGTT